MTASVYSRSWTLVKTQREKHKIIAACYEQESAYTLSVVKLTFACLDAIKPHVISVSVAGTSAVLIPSTARSATTDSAGFLKRAALCTRHRISGHWGDGSYAD